MPDLLSITTQGVIKLTRHSTVSQTEKAVLATIETQGSGQIELNELSSSDHPHVAGLAIRRELDSPPTEVFFTGLPGWEIFSVSESRGTIQIALKPESPGFEAIQNVGPLMGEMTLEFVARGDQWGDLRFAMEAALSGVERQFRQIDNASATYGFSCRVTGRPVARYKVGDKEHTGYEDAYWDADENPSLITPIYGDINNDGCSSEPNLSEAPVSHIV